MNWAEYEGCLPQSQLGFVPGRSTLQAAFLLRHCVETAKANRHQLFSVFVGFQAAYDTVDRRLLFEHLHGLGMPEQLLALIRHIYQGDVYVLVDGDKQARVEPKRGVKQGCPMSPTLFALYISDLPQAIRQHDHERGARTGLSDLVISDLELADDLALLANSDRDIQVFLQRLQTYAARKRLTINVGKQKLCFLSAHHKHSGLSGKGSS